MGNNSKSKIIKYHCIHCGAQLETHLPTKNELGRKKYWDTMVICGDCGGLFFRAVWADGRVNVYTIITIEKAKSKGGK